MRGHVVIVLASLCGLVAARAPWSANTSAPSSVATSPEKVAAHGHPRLTVSRHVVGPGQLILVKATDCPRLYAQRDELTWHNARELNPSRDNLYAADFRLHRTGNTLTTRFRVPPDSPPGRGLLDMFCGDNAGNATAYVSVEPSARLRARSRSAERNTLYTRLEGACPREVLSPGPFGTRLPTSEIGTRSRAVHEVIFGLAGGRGGLFSVEYPAISLDSGRTWRVDGPCFHYSAAQGGSAADGHHMHQVASGAECGIAWITP